MPSFRIPNPLRRLVALLIEVARRFHRERCSDLAASLSFTTLLSLVPLLALALAVISRLPVAEQLGAATEQFVLKHLLPDKAGAVVANYLLAFSEKASQVTLAGSALLVIAAVFMTVTVDHAFNAIWRVERRRRLLPSIVSHALVLVAGPALLGTSLAATTFVVSTSLGWVDEPRWVRTALFRLLPDLVLIGVFALIFFAVPNRPVRFTHAAAGGAVAGIGLLLMQRLFSLYVVKLPTYSLVYGAFAAIPIFLVWLYLSWAVILIGALIAATLPDLAPARPES